MKRFAAMLAIVGLVASASFAGTVQFDPALTEVLITDIANPVVIQATLNADAGNFDAANVVIGANDGLTITDFSYTQEFSDAADFLQAPQVIGIYTSDLFVGGFASAGLSTPLVLGTLTVTLPPTAQVGDEFLFSVDPSIDGFSSLGSEPLNGSGMVRVVPEPATLCLLGLGAVGLIRRRRFA